MIKKLIRAILSWINRKKKLWKIRRMWANAPHAKVRGVSIKELQKEYRVPVSFHKPEWTSAEKGAPIPGRYIVKHKGRLREAIFKIFNYGWYTWKAGFIIDHKDTVPMKGVTAWYPAPENLIKIW